MGTMPGVNPTLLHKNPFKSTRGSFFLLYVSCMAHRTRGRGDPKLGRNNTGFRVVANINPTPPDPVRLGGAMV